MKIEVSNSLIFELFNLLKKKKKKKKNGEIVSLANSRNGIIVFTCVLAPINIL